MLSTHAQASSEQASSGRWQWQARMAFESGGRCDDRRVILVQEMEEAANVR